MATHDIDTLQIEIEASSDEATKKIRSLTSALKSLKKQLEMPNTAGVAADLKKVSSGAETVEKSLKSAGSGAGGAALKFGVLYATLKRVGNTMAGWIQESNDYVENLNLFTVAMGDAAEEAKLYAGEVQSALGIDPSEWMRNQGMFKQIATGFGVASESANTMSKNLTQLGYDISSFYNISIEEAMNKLQSGIAGELEPLRRLGYALDVATLQQVAYEHGITQSVNSMTQAQKSQLRYLAIMEQSGNAMGDLARTVQTPANALRILKQQVTQLSRALGNLLIPALQTILPIAQAVVEVATDAVQRLAELAGFVLPEIDYSGLGGITSGATDAENALEGATDAAKKLKKAVIGIDELNILGDNTASSELDNGAYDLGLKLPEYDFLSGVQGEMDNLKDAAKDVLELAISIGATLAAWKVTPTVLSTIDSIKKAVSGELSKASKYSIGLTLVVSGAALSYDSGYDLGYDGGGPLDIVKGALGPTAATLGGMAIGSAILPGVGTVAGGITGLLIGITMNAVGYIKGEKQGLKDQFYQTELGKEVASLASDIERATVSFDAITGEISADNLAKLELAKNLLSSIFTTYEKDNLTRDEIVKLIADIGVFNSLGLTEITYEFDGVKLKINEARSELEKFISEMENRLKLEALSEGYIEKYKALYEAESALAEIEKTRNEIAGRYESYQRRIELYGEAISALEQEKLALEAEYGVMATGLDRYSEINEAISQYENAIGILQESAIAMYPIYSELNSRYDEQKKKVDALKSSFDSYRKSFISDTNEIVSACTELSTALGSVSSAISGLPSGGAKGSLTFETPFYASGGFPQHGEMFVARESGPEMVGRIGSRTAVANNDQIVAAVSDGVYQAVLAATKSAGSRQANGGQQVVKVYLDSKEITARQNQVNRAYGR